MHPTFWRALLSIDRKRCLFLGFERKLSFFNVTDPLSVNVTVEATFPDVSLCCVQYSFSWHFVVPVKHHYCSSVFPLQVSAIQVAHYFVSRRTSWPWDSIEKSTSIQRILYIPFRLRLGLWCQLCPGAIVHLLVLTFVAALTWMGNRKELWDMCRACTEIILPVGNYHRR